MRVKVVKTTGIYCRADCGAKPRPENVHQAQNPVAALAAGFRPCLRCRPDRLPNLGLGPTTAELAQALLLIGEGFLDHHSADALAARVGYSARHLGRLFHQHIGASPVFVARARRAHLARRLLDESDLPITRVAFAAGYSSLRHMNREMRALFGFSPRELRDKRRSKDLLNAIDGGLRLRLPYSGHVAGQALIDSLSSRCIPGVEAVTAGRYFRTIQTCGHPGVAEVADPGDGQHLEVTLHLATFDSIMHQLESVRQLFGLIHDTREAEETLGRDPILGPLIRKCPGLRIPGAWDRFETAIRIIVGQQVSVAGASTVAGRIAQRYGEKIDIPLPHGLTHQFPSPLTLSRARPQRLGMPQARVNAVVSFAKAVSQGRVDLTKTGPLTDILAMLEAVPGIGPWTANLVAIRAMGHLDAFPAGDLGLRKSVDRLQARRQPITAKQLETLSAKWRPFRAIAAAYLWMAPTIVGDLDR